MPNEFFHSVVLNHASRYPLMQPVDWYKLAFQAAFGSEHAVGSIEMVQARLEHEIAALGTGPIEPLMDPISGDGRIVRVHLRPYAQRGYAPEALVQAFVKTASVIHGSVSELEAYIRKIVDLARENKVNLEPKILSDFANEMSRVGYPMVHHSAEFVEAYRPAYRVVARDFLPKEVDEKLHSG